MQAKDMCEVRCEVTKANEDVVHSVKNQMPELATAAQIFKALADETRLKIAYALTIEEELCVCDVAAIIRFIYSNSISSFTIFTRYRLAKSQRKGKHVYYSLADHHVSQR